jgi:uncharacterized protein YjbI with pentapeptide repeats
MQEAAMLDHRVILERGVEEWNAWRAREPDVDPDLRRAVLRDVDLSGANLCKADLSFANLQRARLAGADLASAVLRKAHLSGADLRNANLRGADLSDAVLGDPAIEKRDFWRLSRYPGDDLGSVIWAPLESRRSIGHDYVRYDIPDGELADWRDHIMGGSHDQYRPANLSGCCLEKAVLERALCDRVDFRAARLGKANLTGARLTEADLSGADLGGARLADADLKKAVVSRSMLRKADRRRHSRWAEAEEVDTLVLTHGFHEFLTGSVLPPRGDLRLTLVHGTFAGRAAWITEEGELSALVMSEAERDVHVHPFRWSGRNTFRARRVGADALRAHLQNLIEQHPDDMHCAVAHSHGGTILLHALRDVDIADRLSRVIFLATPFIRTAPTPEPWQSTFALGLNGLAIAAILGAAHWVKQSEPRPNLWLGLVLTVLAVAAFLACGRGVGVLLRKWAAFATSLHAANRYRQLRRRHG